MNYARAHMLELICVLLCSRSDNAERLHMLESGKEPYLFSSDDLIQLVEITPSLKTRIEMISMIGPRLTDPTAKVAVFTGMFRYTEDKNIVEEVLKARTHAINASKFTNRAGTNALRPGGGRGGAGRGVKMASALAGRGAAGRGGSRVQSVPATLSGKSQLSPKASPKGLIKTPSFQGRPLPSTPSTPSSPQPSISADSSPTTPFASPVTRTSFRRTGSASNKEKLRNPEESPEDGVPSPTSADTDGETVDTKSTASSIPAFSHKSNSEYTTALSTPANTQPAAGGELLMSTVRPLPVTPSAQSSLSHTPSTALATPSSKEQPEPVTAAGTPVIESKPTKVEPERRPSATLASALFSSVAEDVSGSASSGLLSVPSSATSQAADSVNNSARSTPVPVMLEITARAPQRGPPQPSTRRVVHNGPSPVPGTAPPQKISPTITPSPSSGNLQALASSTPGTTSSTPTPPPAPVSHGYYDSAPMVADCKPEVGVHSLLSKFSGTGGTKFGSAAGRPPTAPDMGKSPPTPSARKIGDLANAFAMRPATSTASSTYTAGYSRPGGGNSSSAPVSVYKPGASISAAEARSQAPSPIVIPGASLSLAEMRAKFSGSGSGSANSSACSTPYLTPKGAHSVASSPTRLLRSDSHSGPGMLQEPATERKLQRRHSESQFPFANMANASGNGGNAVSAPVAAEVAGAGADLATRCAAALHLSKAEFLALQPEAAVFTPAVETDTDLPQFTYREIVRRNFCKEYAELNQAILELYVCDEEFVTVFSRNKVSFELSIQQLFLA
jgi:hypothetical protein